MATRYKKDPKTGKLAGSYAGPVSPQQPASNRPRRRLSEIPAPRSSTTNYDELADAARTLTRAEQALEDRREQAGEWARTVPTGRAATREYFAILAQELDTTPDDILFRYEVLKAAAVAGDDLGEPDTATARYVTKARTRNGEGRIVGTPSDAASCRAIAHLETLAADKRREKRAHLEQVDEDGTRWVRYSNDRYSEILRGVAYNPDARQLTVYLAGRTKDEDGQTVPTTTPYVYNDVDPTIVRHLVSARSMGRFYSYVLSPLTNNGSLGNATLRDYTFMAHYSNFLWPTQSGTTGPMPAPKALQKVQQNPSAR